MIRREFDRLKTYTTLTLKKIADDGWVPVDRVGHALDEAFKLASTPEPEMVTGWRAIAAAVGAESVNALTVASSLGRLPVKPISRGRHVCMTQEQIAELRAHLNKKGQNRR